MRGGGAGHLVGLRLSLQLGEWDRGHCVCHQPFKHRHWVSCQKWCWWTVIYKNVWAWFFLKMDSLPCEVVRSVKNAEERALQVQCGKESKTRKQTNKQKTLYALECFLLWLMKSEQFLTWSIRRLVVVISLSCVQILSHTVQHVKIISQTFTNHFLWLWGLKYSI